MNKIYDDLVACGAISPDAEDKEAVLNVLGQHINPLFKEVRGLREALQTDKDVDWIENDPVNEFDALSEMALEIEVTIQNL
jgi:hypothetical protein